MSSYPDANAGYDQKPQKGWFGRNWWWFVPAIIILPIFCCCGVCGGGFYFAMNKVQDFPPYKDGIATAISDAQVETALGKPVTAPDGLIALVKAGGELKGETSNGSPSLTARVPLEGSTGSGMLYIEAESADGVTWTYTRFEVIVDRTSEVIELSDEAGKIDLKIDDLELPDPAVDPTDTPSPPAR